MTGPATVESGPSGEARDVSVSDVEFLLRLARSAHEGYPTADLEERIVALARALGQTETEVSATPTLVEISLGALPDQRTWTLRMRPAAVDLAAIAELDDLVSAVLDRRLDGTSALVIGLAGGLVGRQLRRSPLIFIVPGVLMLVPGSTGFTSALQLLAGQTVSGIAAAFDTFVTAMSIAYGLMVATVVLPGRLAVASPRGADA